MYTWCTGQR